METNKALHKYATVEERTKFALDERRQFSVSLPLPGEERLQPSSGSPKKRDYGIVICRDFAGYLERLPQFGSADLEYWTNDAAV